MTLGAPDNTPAAAIAIRLKHSVDSIAHRQTSVNVLLARQMTGMNQGQAGFDALSEGRFAKIGGMR